MKCLNFVFFLPLFSSLCFSQVRQGDINFGFSLGFNYYQVTEYDETEETTSSFSLSTGMGYFFTNHINCGLFFSFSDDNNGQFSIDVGDGSSSSDQRLSIMPFIRFYPKPQNKNRMYIQINGIFNYRLDKKEQLYQHNIPGSRNELGVSLNPGIELSTGKKWSLVGSMVAFSYLKNFQKPSTRSLGICTGGSIGFQRIF